MNEWKELINSTGFPIATFLLMFWFVNTTLSKHTETLGKINETLVMLCTKMDKCDK